MQWNIQKGLSNKFLLKTICSFDSLISKWYFSLPLGHFSLVTLRSFNGLMWPLYKREFLYCHCVSIFFSVCVIVSQTICVPLAQNELMSYKVQTGWCILQIKRLDLMFVLASDPINFLVRTVVLQLTISTTQFNGL